MEWTVNIFDWKGFEFNLDLAETTLFETILDFRAQFNKALNGAAKQTCSVGPCYP